MNQNTGVCCRECGCRHMISQGVQRVGRFTIRYRECRHCGTVHRTREEVCGVPQKYKPREKPRSEPRQKKLWDIEKPNAENEPE